MKRITALLFTLIFLASSVVPSFATGGSEPAAGKTILTAEAGEVTIALRGEFPEGAELEAELLEEEEAEPYAAEVEKLRKKGLSSAGTDLWDIRVTGGEEIPALSGEAELTFTYPGHKDSGYEAQIYLAGADKTEALRTKTEDDEITAKTRELSVFAVDFTFEEQRDDNAASKEEQKDDNAASKEEQKGDSAVSKEEQKGDSAAAEEDEKSEDGSSDDGASAKGEAKNDSPADESASGGEDSVTVTPPEKGEPAADKPSFTQRLKKFLGLGKRAGSENATELPVTADGITVEKARIKWRHTTNDTVSMTDVFDDMPFSVDIAVSGRGMIDEGDLEVEIPAYIWTTRSGDIAHELTLGVPPISEADSSSSDFAYRKSGDKVYITNIRRMSAAMKISIDGTYRARAKASAMVDGSVSDDLYAVMNLNTPRSGQLISVVTNSINGSIDTGVAIDKGVSMTDRRYTDEKLYQTSAPEWASEYEATRDDPNAFYYLEWKVFSAADGTQAFDLYFEDEPADAYGGIVLGIGRYKSEYDEQGKWVTRFVADPVEEDGSLAVRASERFTRDYQGTEYVRRRAYYGSTVRVAYPKSAFADGTHTLKNNVTANVLGTDDRVKSTKTETFSTVIKTKTPEDYTIKLVWDLNEDQYATPVATIRERCPDTWRVRFHSNQGWFTSEESKDWTVTWNDGGVGNTYEGREYRETKTHGEGGISGTSLVEGVIGMRTMPDGTVQKDIWWFDTRAKEYDAATKTWTIYNDYHEGSEPISPVYSSRKEAERYRHRQYFTNAYDTNPAHLDINDLNRGKETDEIVYAVHNNSNVIEYTTEGDSYKDFFDKDKLKKREVTLEMHDKEPDLNEKSLTNSDYYISSVSVAPPLAKDFVPDSSSTGHFGDRYFEPFELYGLAGGKWILLVRGDENIALTAQNGAEVKRRSDDSDYYGKTVNYERRTVQTAGAYPREGFLVSIGRKNVTEVKMVVRTKAAEIDAGFGVGITLLPSESNLKLLNSSKVRGYPEYVYGKLRNHANFRLYNNDGNIMNETKSANSYVYGKDIRLGFNLVKTSAQFENDIGSRVLRSKQSLRLDRECTVDDAETIRDMYDADLMPDTWYGTFYDLLPAGTSADMSSLQLTYGTILSTEVIQNWRGSGRNMLRVSASFREQGTYRISGGRAVWYDPVLSFELIYPWEEARSLGLADVRNLAVYVSDEPHLGNMAGRMGEKDEPSGENHTASKTAIKENERSLVSDLYEGRDPRAIYAGVNIPYTHYDFAASSELHKYVQPAGASVWTDGLDKPAVVAESGNYQYRLMVSSGADSTTHDIVMIDVLEDYEPYRITDPGGNEKLKAGDLIAEHEFIETNQELEAHGKNPMTGEKMKGWKGSFRGINVSEMELMGAKPVVYYSTKSGLDVSAYTDQTDPKEGEVLKKIQRSGDWSVTPPSDLSEVTAVAIDCTKKEDGSDYELDKQETLIAYLYMKAPEYDLESEIFDEEEYYNHLKNRSAYNGFYANTSIRDAIGTAASHSYHIFEFTKTDIYAPKMKIKKKWADNNNNDRKRPESVSLTLMANGRPSGTTVDLTAEENWEKELGYMRLYDEDGNMIRYTLKEGDVKGYTSDPAVMTVKDGVASIEITNRHENETVDIPFSKTWAPRKEGDEEWEEKIPDSLSFRLSGGTTSKTQTLYKADFDGNTWSGSFTGMQKYRAGKEINYTVKELLESDAWYSERGTGKNDIRNIYYPYGSLEVVKNLVGDTAKAGQKDFVFSISFRSGGEVYRENVPYKIVDRASGEELRSGSFEGSGEFALKKTEKLVIEELGTSVDYEIDEKPLEGFTLESSSKTAGRVSPHTTTTASFTNRYRSGCSVGINGTKTLDGKELKRNQFRFELRDESGRVVSAVGNRADGGISFGDLSYTQKDDGKTFVYRASEVVQKKGGYTFDGTVYRVYVRPVDNGDGTMDCSIAYKKVTHPGEAAKRAEIEAKQKEIDALLPDDSGYEENLDRLQAELDALELELEAILAGDGEETDADGISFSNTYRAAGSIVLKAYKSLKNGDIGDYSFRFDLYDGEGRLIDSENNNREGNILFEALHFDQKDAGKTYYYAIREHAGDEEAVVYDKKVYGYRIRVIDNNDGTLSFNQAPFNADEMFLKDESGELITDEYGHLVKNESFTEKEGDLPLFKNSMKPGSLSVAKFVDNPDSVPESEKDHEFEFVIKLTGDEIGDKTFDFDLEDVEEQEIKVTFNACGGYFNGNEEKTEIEKTYTGTSAGTLFEDLSQDTLKRPGYAFEGWFEDAEYTKPYDHNEHLTKDTTLYAKWVDKDVLYEDGTFVIAEPSYQRAENKEAHGNVVSEYDYAPDGYTASGEKMQPYLVEGVNRSILRVRFGTLVRPLSLSYYFRNMVCVQDIDLTNLDSSDATSMMSMFSGAGQENSGYVKVTGLSELVTGNVTSMNKMFLNSRLESYDVRNFDTSEVTDMEDMFRSLYRKDNKAVRPVPESFELDISGFDTANVTNMLRMFADCQELKEIHVSKAFVTSGITEETNGKNMFRNDSALKGTGNHHDVAHTGEGGRLTEKAAPEYVPKPKTDGTVHLPTEIRVRIPKDPSGGGSETVPGDPVSMHDGEMTVKIKGGQAAVLNDIPAGTAYQVYEVTHDGWILVKTVEASGKIIGNETQAALFHNRYDPEKTSVQFNGTKMLDGMASDRAFGFELSEKIGGDYSVKQEKDSAAGGAVSFDPIVYGAEDAGKTFVYRIREKAEDDGSIIYDDHEETITVSVSAEEGRLSRKVTYAGGGMTWKNSTKPGRLEISKITDIKTDANKDDEFTIKATLEDRNGIPLTFDAEYFLYDAEGNVKGGSTPRKMHAVDGNFTVKLKAGEKVCIINGPAGNRFTIEETDLPDGWVMTDIDEAQHQVVADSSGIASVTNSYRAEVEPVIKAYKLLKGRAIQQGEFTFSLSDEDGRVLQTARNYGRDSDRNRISEETGYAEPNPYYGMAPVSFTLPVFTQEDIGKTFTYKIAEVPGNDDSLAYDGHEETVKVRIEDAGGGVLKAVADYDSDGPVFTNSLDTGSLSIRNTARNATKAAAGTVFGFRINLKDSMGMELDGEYAAVKTENPSLAAGRVNGLFTAGLGTSGVRRMSIRDGSTFTLRDGETLEISGLPDGAQYDIEELELDRLAKEGWTLESTDNIKGSVIRGEEQKAAFVNVYSTSGTAEIKAVKVLLGGELKAGAYSFELYDSSGQKVSVAGNDASGNVVFKVPYDRSSDGRTYEYVVKEADGGERGITYDRNGHSVKVAVADNGKGTLSVKTSTDGEIKFVNAVNRTLTVKKAVEGRKADRNRKFRYRVSFDGDTEGVNGTGLSMEDDGTYSFTLKDGGSIAIRGVPHGTKYKITEEDTEYVEKVNGRKGRKASGTITGDTTVSYVNRLDESVSPDSDRGGGAGTGDRNDLLLFAGAAAAALIAIVLMLRRRTGKSK